MKRLTIEKQAKDADRSQKRLSGEIRNFAYQIQQSGKGSRKQLPIY
jgi:hypothetical protein